MTTQQTTGISRRLVIATSVAAPAVLGGSAAGALFTCSPEGKLVLDPAVQDAINQAMQKSCGIIVFAGTLVALITTKFPALVGATTIAQSLLNGVVDFLCGAYKNQLQAGKLGATFDAGGGAMVALHGWHIVDGKLVAF